MIIPAKKRSSTEELLELIKQIVADKINSQEDTPNKLLLTVRKTKSYYKEKLDKDISPPTIRDYGLSNDGILLIKYPNVFSYRSEGKRSARGMVIDVENMRNKMDLSEYLDGGEEDGED